MTVPEPAKLLIVDDSPTTVEALLGILEDDYQVSFATSGRQALDLLAWGGRPDLILLDLMMPEMDGLAVCAALKADPACRDIPVIFITARTDVDSETQALDAGGVDFIHKPVQGALVRARVRRHLELRRRCQALEQSLSAIARGHEDMTVFWQAVEQSPTSIVVTGSDSSIQYVNPYFTQETGYTAAEIIGHNPRLLQSGLTDQETFRDMWEHLARGEPWTGELINRRKCGETYCEEAHVAPVKDKHGQITHYVAVKLNVTDRRAAQERRVYLTNYDVLTDLPNRSLFYERLGQALALARRNECKLALISIDLDRFKLVNDHFGHALGDRVLRAVARRLSGVLRASDTVGRIGGDEFLVLLNGVADQASAVMVGGWMGEALRQPFVLDDKTLSISSSIGLALYPDHGRDSVALTRLADAAMYEAKQSGGDTLRVFTTPA